MSAPENPPAFPSAPIADTTDDRHWQRDGMTLRDWFAGQAPTDLVQPKNMAEGAKFIGRPFPSDSSIDDQCRWSMDIEAKARYQYADAMLKARAEHSEGKA